MCYGRPHIRSVMMVVEAGKPIQQNGLDALCLQARARLRAEWRIAEPAALTNMMGPEPMTQHLLILVRSRCASFCLRFESLFRKRSNRNCIPGRRHFRVELHG